jgi:ATP-binding cassette, subfamily B, bacterial HlyB/CyaB
MPSASAAQPVTISAVQWQALLGEDLPEQNLNWLNGRLRINEVPPGCTFWHSVSGAPGIYIVLAGKVRLFDDQGEKLAVIEVGDTFGIDSLFPQRQLPGHSAKSALTKTSSAAIVGVVLAADIEKLWQKFPKINTYLGQHRQLESALKLPGLLGTTASLAPKAIGVGAIAVRPQQAADWSPPVAESAKVKPYFPSPSRRLGQWWQKRLHKYPFYGQQSAADCGAACLVMVGKYWGKSFKINRVREMAVIAQDGSSLKTLAAAAESLGFNSRPVKASVDQLAKQRMPLIAHWRGNHYVVVYEITAKQVIIGDPAIGQRQVSLAEFGKNWTGFCLFVEPTVSLSSGNKDGDQKDQNSSFWQLLELVAPHRTVISEIFVASIVLQLFGLISPIFTQLILDRAVIHKSADSLNAFVIGLLLMAIFQIAMSTLRQYLIFITAIRIDTAMIVGFIRHAFSLPLSYFDTRKVGDITSRIEENHKIRSFITGETIGLILDILSVFVYVTLMYVYSWKLATLVMVSIPPFLILNLLSTPFLKKLSRESFNAYAEENSYLIEALNGVRTVKSMAVERTVRWRWEELLNHEIKQQYQKRMFGIKLQAISSVLDSFSSVALLWLGSSLVISGEFSIGQLFAFNMLSANVIGPFKRLAGIWNQFQEVTIAIERICDVIESPPEEDHQNNNKQQLGRLRGHIVFDQVTFRYNPHTETNTLENLSFEIKPGQTVALVGRSGSGKTTLSKLLLGLYTPTSGKIFIDGKDITQVALHSLRAQIGVVDQSTFLFSGTIAENIGLGQQNASNKAIKQAAIAAGADEFVSVMPMGYETQIGEGGGMLSGGQRQRLAIARSLVGNPSLLVFDEATSSLDTESERIIQKNLETICRNRSAIIIAHRLSTVRNADLILVLDKGILIESGTHGELMAERGQYYYLNQQQLGTIGS